MEKFNETLIAGAAELGINIKNPEKFLQYMEYVLEINKSMNLTAITQPEEFITKHFLDSLTLLPLLPKENNIRIIDIGSGAGFPGIPLKFANSELQITLLDSLNKRVKFLNQVVTKMKLNDIRAIHGRAEEYAQKSDFRESFDFAVARAIAAMPALCGYCLPFVGIGGAFIAMKGSNYQEELKNALPIISDLGGEIEKIHKIILPESDIERNLIIVRKRSKGKGIRKKKSQNKKTNDLPKSPK
ncbi:MAG: 16S rRNA (guanine(527)-N(7))-methyltransferase RsmG [Defluviitaleaceae bacterium]|nr:16S rRNA (guanine(527)-N(7))-methyltransferase RsmG [Defluviitaleaceae bacterium]